MPTNPALPKFNFLDDLSDASRSTLAATTNRVSLPPRTPVLAQGDEISGVFLVEKGSLRIYYVNAEGREGTLYWVDAGQSCILALNCLFSQLPYPAWVETDDAETDVAIISGDAYRELYLKEAPLQKFTFDALSGRLFDLMTLLQETGSLGLEQRLAAFLLRRSGDDEHLDITHERIANHLGTSREVASRVLRNLASRGGVVLGHRTISITDAELLENLVND